MPVMLSSEDQRTHWKDGKLIGKSFFSNTAEFMSMVEIKGIHLAEHDDLETRHNLLREQVAPGGRYLIGYFDPALYKETNNRG